MADINGTPGSDIINGTEGDDLINGGGGNDAISGLGGNDTINGGDGNDALIGDDGDDTLNGDAGNDAVRGGRGADVMDGGAGTNTLNYLSSSTGVTVNLSTGEASGGDAEGDRFTRFQNIDGTFHDDALTGDNGANILDGYTGRDILYGLGGDDSLFADDYFLADSIPTMGSQLYGGDGNDLLFVRAYITGTGAILDGGAGNDNFSIIFSPESSGRANPTIIERAGEGIDTVTLLLETGSRTFVIPDNIENVFVTAYTGAGSAVPEVWTIIGNDLADNILGSRNAGFFYGRGGDDSIGGGEGNDTIDGGSGNDSLSGAGGNDSIVGGTGNDFLSGGSGNDSLDGGEGNDRVDGSSFSFVSGSFVADVNDVDTLRGGLGDDTYVIDSLNDVIIENAGEGIDSVDSLLASGTYTMPEAIENLRIASPNGRSSLEIAYGNAAGNRIDGSQEANTIYGLGGNDRIFGFGGSDIFVGGAGNDTLDGGSNIDTAVVSGLRSAYTITQTLTGVFQVVGVDGTDTLTTIEFLQFDDQIMRLRPGTGVTVNFNTTNPAGYQTALNAVRDFDGNVLGGNGSWLRIGEADVNGDGDIDQILVNRTIARFATIGTAPDGLVYFSDHGWAGETRVAGIYVDPLVEAGIVVAGSGNDSQRRFLNDLAIENINRVLGANDYNNDGIHEVYFALTDGTAYLRALMHADGNIRYANYQSQQEVIDYLTANGFGPSTYAGWFSAPTSGSASLTADTDTDTQSDLARAALPDLLVAESIPLPGAAPSDLALSPHGLQPAFAQFPGQYLFQPDAIAPEFYG